MKIGITGPILIKPFTEYLDTTAPADASGVKGLGGTAVNTLAQGLLERGHELVLFTLDTEVKEELVLGGPRLRICMGPYRSSARRRAFDFFRTEREYIQHAIEREKPDIVHAHWTYEFALGALASGVPTLVTVRDWAPLIWRLNCGNYRTFIYRGIRFLMDRQVFKQALYISANSPYIQRMIKKKWAREVPLIPNSIEDGFFRHDEKIFDAENPVLISINSGMGKGKNLTKLISAFLLIKEKIPNCQLRLIGDDFGKNGKAEKWASKRGLTKGIVFVGTQTRREIIAHLDDSALMIHPSLEESFGNVLVEAMARRVPVLGGENSGAVPWVFDHGRAGGLCNVRSPEDIARKTIEILTSREYWTNLSEAGHERVRDAFNLSSVVDLCLAEYRRIIKNKI